jgi:hypothetical protein
MPPFPSGPFMHIVPTSCAKIPQPSRERRGAFATGTGGGGISTGREGSCVSPEGWADVEYVDDIMLRRLGQRACLREQGSRRTARVSLVFKLEV